MMFLYGALAVLEILSVFGMEMAAVGFMLDILNIHDVSDERTFTIALVSLAVFVIVRVIVAALESRKNEEVGKAGIS